MPQSVPILFFFNGFSHVMKRLFSPSEGRTVIFKYEWYRFYLRGGFRFFLSTPLPYSRTSLGSS